MDMPRFIRKLLGRNGDDAVAVDAPDEPPPDPAPAPGRSGPPAGARPPARTAAARPPATWQFRDANDARCAIFALVIAGTDAARRQAAINFVAAREGLPMAEKTRELYRLAATLPAGERLPWIEDALTRLRTLAAPERERFVKFVAVLIDADKRCTLPEFTLNILLRAALQKPAPAAGVRLARTDVIPEMRLLLSLMARVGADHEDVAARNLSRLMFQLTSATAEIDPPGAINTTALTAALEKLGLVPTLVRETFVKAVAECVTLDGKVKPLEAELLAAMCARLGVPVPPLDFTNLSRPED